MIRQVCSAGTVRNFGDRMNNKQAAQGAGVSTQVDELATISVEALFREAWHNESRFE